MSDEMVAPCMRCGHPRTRWLKFYYDVYAFDMKRVCDRCDNAVPEYKWWLWRVVCDIEKERESAKSRADAI